MSETSLERLVPEADFARLLSREATGLFLRAARAAGRGDRPWGKRELFELHSEADELEACLDDYGARWNAQYHLFTELTASIRGFSLAGLSLEHLHRRLAGYGLEGALGEDRVVAVQAAVDRGRSFVRASLDALLGALRDEAAEVGVEVAVGGEEPEGPPQPAIHFRLPRTLGIQDLTDEEQRIAEVASKYLQAADMLAAAGLERSDDPVERERLLLARCREEHARVFEATVHNLQSAYDTHIKNTRREAEDGRLPRLRGHVSATLHLLEAVTQLVHFVERHENGERAAEAQERLAALVPRDQVHTLVLNDLGQAALEVLEAGRALAEDLLPSYTDVQAITLEIPAEVTLHARPIALLVAVVHHHGTPVELELAGKVANAGSILEVMILAGSNPEHRELVFRGDTRPLEDLRRLFEAGIGEWGLERLPEDLGYLRG
jgi:phosphotransferase system HPr (HPr) family protein